MLPLLLAKKFFSFLPPLFFLKYPPLGLPRASPQTAESYKHFPQWKAGQVAPTPLCKSNYCICYGVCLSLRSFPAEKLARATNIRWGALCLEVMDRLPQAALLLNSCPAQAASILHSLQAEMRRPSLAAVLDELRPRIPSLKSQSNIFAKLEKSSSK